MDLDKWTEFEKIDQTDLLKNIKEFPDQCQKAWEEVKKVVLPSYYVKADKIVILGMGGSSIGGDLAKTFASKKTKIPIFVHRDYNLPKFVDKNSLVIGISYSGDTEEILEAFFQAQKIGAKLIAITTGGKLARHAQSYKIPLYLFNYQSQPRQALGFLFISLLGIFNKIAIIDLKDDEVNESILLLKAQNSKIKPEIKTAKNRAKRFAKELFDKIPIIIGTEVSAPIALRFKTQLNENSKNLAFYEIIPEACHNFVAGLNFPSKLSGKIFVFIISSKYDHQRVKTRQNILMEILDKNKIPFEILTLEPNPTPLSEMLQMISFLDFTSYYLAILNDVDPSKIENIKFLKNRLSEIKWQK